jgi:hypothetical protein
MAETEMVQVDPGPGPEALEQTAAALIRLADHPHDVVWRSRGSFFLVPEVVAVRYAAEVAAAGGGKPAETTGGEAKAPRARRRASSKTAAADSNAAPAESAKPRSRASRSKRKGGDS